MTNSLRERRKQMLRDEILDSAHALLAEKGYTAMSMDELAAHAGISKPTLYSHFATKEELVVAAVIRELDRLIGLLTAELGNETPLQRLSIALRKIIQYHLTRGGEGLRPIATELFHILCVHQEAAARLRRLDAAIKNLVQAGMAQGEIDSALDPATVVRVFYALANTLRFAALSEHSAPDPSTATDTLTAILERGLRAAVPGNRAGMHH